MKISPLPEPAEAVAKNVIVYDTTPTSTRQRDSTRMEKIHIGHSKYVSANTFGGRVGVHVRQYARSVNGKEFPTRKGVCLSKGAYAELMKMENLIDRAVLDAKENVNSYLLQKHIANGFVITINGDSNTIDFRRYFLPPGSDYPIPTRIGISMHLFAWEALKEALKECAKNFEELKKAEPCNCVLNQGNQMFECAECRPFGLVGFEFDN